MPAAIVTGSDSGIGRATAVALAERGFDVGITWHSDEPGATETKQLVRSSGRKAAVAHLDLGDAGNARGVIERLAADLGDLTALINNAAIDHRADLLEETLDSWGRVLAVNLTGQFLCAQAAARLMVREGQSGRIVNVTSIHEFVPVRGGAAYCAAKAGLGLLTKVMALELAEHGITVNSVAPGHICTPMTTSPDRNGDQHRRIDVPVGRVGRPREVATAIAHMCSPDAAYTTGNSFVVDGGLLLMAVECLNQDVAGPPI